MKYFIKQIELIQCLSNENIITVINEITLLNGENKTLKYTINELEK